MDRAMHKDNILSLDGFDVNWLIFSAANNPELGNVL